MSAQLSYVPNVNRPALRVGLAKKQSIHSEPLLPMRMLCAHSRDILSPLTAILFYPLSCRRPFPHLSSLIPQILLSLSPPAALTPTR